MTNYTPWITPNTQLSVMPSGVLAAPPPAPPVRSRTLASRDPIGRTVSELNLTQRTMLALHGSVLVAVAYHGYKRNKNSVPWGLGWALGGLVCPTVTMAFALSQGFATTRGSA